MRELLFQSNIGIRFVKEVHKGICTVKVQSRNANRAMTLMSYTFPNVELSVSSPFGIYRQYPAWELAPLHGCHL